MKRMIGAAAALVLLLSGCGTAKDTQPQLPEESVPTMTEAFTRTSSISSVIYDSAFGSFGRLLFPTDEYYYSGDTLEELQLVYYSHIDPDETVEIVNALKERAEAGQTIFYDIYTDESAIIGLSQNPVQTGGDLALFFLFSAQFSANEGVPA